MFKFGKRPKLSSQVEERVFYNEIIGTLQRFNSVAQHTKLPYTLPRDKEIEIPKDHQILKSSRSSDHLFQSSATNNKLKMPKGYNIDTMILNETPKSTHFLKNAFVINKLSAR